MTDFNYVLIGLKGIRETTQNTHKLPLFVLFFWQYCNLGSDALCFSFFLPTVHICIKLQLYSVPSTRHNNSTTSSYQTQIVQEKQQTRGCYFSFNMCYEIVAYTLVYVSWTFRALLRAVPGVSAITFLTPFSPHFWTKKLEWTSRLCASCMHDVPNISTPL